MKAFATRDQNRNFGSVRASKQAYGDNYGTLQEKRNSQKAMLLQPVRKTVRQHNFVNNAKSTK